METVTTVATTPTPTGIDSVNQEVLASQTLTELLPELKALGLEELIQINVDVPSAIATVLGSLPEIRAYREEIVKSMASFDIASFDKLEAYAIALNDAHGEYLTAAQPADDFDNLLEEGVHLRELLLSDANALALRGLVDGNKLSELKGVVGHKNLAPDLNVLYKVLQSSWPQIEGKSAVQPAELERASKLGQRIIRLVGLRAQGTATVAAATDLRIRAFTLFTRAYDNVRRGISFLRWNEGDSEKIAPSLFAGRGAVRHKGTEVPPDGPAHPAPSAGAGGSGALPPGGAVAASGSQQRAPTGPAGEAASAAAGGAVAGTPDAEPFLHS
jgi:hypothetical protein